MEDAARKMLECCILVQQSIERLVSMQEIDIYGAMLTSIRHKEADEDQLHNWPSVEQ